MAKEKSTHQQIAESVVGKVKKATRDKLTITAKGAYSIVSDEDGWLVRLTPRIAEFSKKRITPDDLEASGCIDTGKDGQHRKHRLGGELALASVEDGAIREAQEKELEGAGVEELAAAVEKAARKPKAAKAEAKS